MHKSSSYFCHNNTDAWIHILERSLNTHAWEAGRLTLSFHFSSISFKSYSPVSCPALQQTTCSTLLFLSAPASSPSHRFYFSNFLPPTHCFISASASSASSAIIPCSQGKKQSNGRSLLLSLLQIQYPYLIPSSVEDHLLWPPLS